MPTTFAAQGPTERPDWGPARRDPEHPLHPAALDLRDESDERPDDN